MDIIKANKGILKGIGKYKYVLIVILVGILFMQFPSGKIAGKTAVQPIERMDRQNTDYTAQLTEILAGIENAGEVKVLLSCAKGEETIYQTDISSSENEGKSDKRVETVLVTDSSRNETGLIAQKNPPVYIGAVILAQGADDPRVKLAIVDAVSKATGLGADKISVLKMK